ncbi:hypothetical protein ACLQ3K_21940 [Tsukamurella sp. DT100]|uniref:hypothetical protein n=1 Tax=Tsukamurella sp. DT100 TaxID=3393415 RepID=UPI003CF68C6D
MTATKHSAEAFLVVDPQQDYEESDTTWGVYGSLQAAKIATPRLRRHRLIHWNTDRDTEIQRWRGDQLIGTWTYHGNPDSALHGTWTYEEHP